MSASHALKNPAAELPEADGASGGNARRWAHICSALQPFARAHIGWFIRGSVAALFVVGARLALPWPLRTVLIPLLGPHGHSGRLPSWLPADWNPALVAGIAFLMIMLVLGLADMLVRLYFARFAIGTTIDFRAAAFAASVRSNPATRSTDPGDLVARLIGDSQRLRVGLKSFLIHVVTNSILFAGMIGVLLWMDLTLGLIFAGAGMLTAVITAVSAREVYHSSLKSRTKEGKRADKIQKAFVVGLKEGGAAPLKSSTGYSRASVTRLQGIATLCTHAVFGLTVLASLWFGSQAVAAGRLDVGHIVVFTLYAVMMRAPIVRLARQGARTGKILAAGDRLVTLMEEARMNTTDDVNAPVVEPLRERLQLSQVLVKGSKRHGRQLRIACQDLNLHPGEKVAVIGEPGAGKSTLLELLAGLRQPKSGHVFWDEMDLAGVNARSLAERVAYAPQRPTWLRRSLRELLHVTADAPDAATLKLLDLAGVGQTISRLPGGWETRINSEDLSPGEARVLAFVRAIRQRASVLLLDDPFSGLAANAADALAQALFAPTDSPELVVIAMSKPAHLERFDRVIALAAGHVVFDGSSRAWIATRANEAKMAGHTSAET